MRIIIHSSNRLFGECLAAGLAALDDVDAADFFDSFPAITSRVLGTQRPTVLIDLVTPEADDLAPRIKMIAPNSCILALSVDDENPENVVGCARMGFDAFVPRGARLESVPAYIRRARCGEVVLAPRATASLFRALAGPPRSTSLAPTETMTRREREVCLLACDGLTNKEIARELNRSVGTIKNHIHAILWKLNVPRRGAIATRVMHTGMMAEEKRRTAK